MEVDTAYVKNFTIKKEDTTTSIIPDPANIEERPLFFSKALRPKRKKTSKLFTEKEIDSEIRSHLGEILFLKPTEYKREYDKAYNRLYYKHKSKHK